jgi:outer membrane protein TolC
LLLCLVGGCGRSWYRRDADMETTAATEEHITDPRWDVPYISINPNPTSRLFDPYDPDFPPLPPDDPAASQYMVRANGMPGYRRWHKNGDAPFIEDPQWRNFLPLDAKGVLVLSREKAVELAWLHSRDYQTQLELLYTQSLTLTFQRFAFELHWFGTNATTFTGMGDGDTAVHTLATTTTAGFTKALGAGGQFLAEFANTFVFTFTGSGSTTMTSNLIFNLLQPLLRQFGRDVAMEGLTQAERSLLYAVRDFVRFRKNFYVNVTSGRFSSFLSLLLQVQNIRNLEASVASRERNLELVQANYDSGTATLVDVDQAFVDLQTARLSLLQARTNLETAFDAYKTSLLSLPPDIPIRLDDSLLAPFQLADPALEKLRKEMDTLFAEYREFNQAPPLAKLQQGFRQMKDFQAAILKLVDQVAEEIEKWKKQPPGPGEDAQEIKRQRASQESLTKQIPDLRDDLQKLTRDIDEALLALKEDKRQEGWESLPALMRRQIDISAELLSLQNQARVYLIRLEAVKWTLDAAVDYARTNRLDLMNERGRVVDAWRQIAVTANALKSDLNINLNATLATPPGSLNPVGFSASANTYSVGVTFAAPLNRLAERNNYRQSLINYQGLRRAFMALDDAIVSAIRRDLRQLETDRLNFDITRRTVVAAARAVEFAEASQRLPQMPGQQDTSGPLKVLRAYDDLLTQKNNLIGNWVSYETDRIQLLLDLEALQLDEREVDTNEPDDQSVESAPNRSGQPGHHRRRRDSDDQPIEAAPAPKPLGSRDAGRPDGVEAGQPAGQAVP